MTRLKPVIEGRGVASIARNLTYLLGGRGVYFVTRFIYVVILARILGPQIYGMISYGIAWYLLFIPLTSMGLAVVLSRDVGEDRERGKRTAALTLTLRVVSILVATVAYFILSVWIEDDPSSRLLIFVFSFALMGRSLALWTENVYTAYEVNRYSFWQQSIFRSLEVVLGLVVLMVWREALPVVIIHGLVWCLQAVYGLTMIHRQEFPLRLNRNIPDLYRIFLQGLPLAGSTFLMAVVYQGPLIFFRHLVPDGNALGQMALAMQVLFVLAQIPSALGSVSLPVLSRAAARQDGKDRIFAETALRFSLFFGTALALLGTVLGPWVIAQIFGKNYVQAGALVGPVMWLLVPSTAGHALVMILMARKLDFQALFCALFGAVLFSLTISELVLKFGAFGAICSAGIGMMMTMTGFILVLRNRLAMDLRASLIKPGLTALAAAGVYHALHAFGPGLSLPGAFLVLALGGYLFKCLTPQDMIWFQHSLGSFANKKHSD